MTSMQSVIKVMFEATDVDHLIGGELDIKMYATSENHRRKRRYKHSGKKK